MRQLRTSALLALVPVLGCSASSAPTRTLAADGHAPAPSVVAAPARVAPRAVSREPAEPEPNVAATPPRPHVSLFGDPTTTGSWGFTSDGLPAVSTDGKRYAVAQIDEDGPRGDPNLRLLVRDVDTERVVSEGVVLEADKEPAAVAAGTLTLEAELARRLASANALLDAETWMPAPPSTAAPDGACGEPVSPPFRAEKIVVELAGSRLTVRTPEGRVVVDRRVPSWMAPRRGECENPAFVSSVAFDDARRILLIQVGYCGNDSCWEPSSGWHALRLP